MDVVVLADTHLRAAPEGRLPEAVLAAIDAADLVLHAGDVVSRQALAGLRARASVKAVLGNNDRELHGALPESLVLELEGVTLAMVHDSGPAAGRAARLHRRFPSAGVVVFGHSHAPLDEVGLGGQRLFNPGSPTQRRRQARHSYGRLEIADGRLVRHEICEL